MLVPTLPGWKAETIGDDICWMKFGDDGRLYAINPEFGMFGVAPGTGLDTNANAIAALTRNTVFTNVALTDDGDVWWEGLTDEPPAHCTDWKGNDWTPGVRRAGRAPQQPLHRAAVAGAVRRARVGGPERRADLGDPVRRPAPRAPCPLVTEAYNWRHGVFLGSIMGSETTAAAAGAVGNLRRDPFAMLPFCGYNMGDYFAHWLTIGESADAEKLPKLFYVNWFRKDADGKFLWPGYGENSRVLAWVFDRCANAAAARDTAIGRLPDGRTRCRPTVWSSQPGALDELLSVDEDEWRAELPLIEEHYARVRRPAAAGAARRARRPRPSASPTSSARSRWACSAGSSSASSPARWPGPVTGGGWNLGCLGTIVVGVVGGLLGGALFNAAGDHGIGDFGLRSMFVAFVGAVRAARARRPRRAAARLRASRRR